MRTTACITTPETDRPAPTTIAIKTRGNRIFQMISAVVLWRSSAYWAGSLRKIRQTRMRATSGMAISTGPNVMELRTDNSNRTSSTTTHRVNGKRRRPAFRLVFAIDGFTLVIFIPLFPRFGVCLERVRAAHPLRVGRPNQPLHLQPYGMANAILRVIL